MFGVHAFSQVCAEKSTHTHLPPDSHSPARDKEREHTHCSPSTRYMVIIVAPFVLLLLVVVG